jgi:hypothetical protein
MAALMNDKKAPRYCLHFLQTGTVLDGQHRLIDTKAFIIFRVGLAGLLHCALPQA